MPGGLQVLLPASDGNLVAGLPCALRTAHRAHEELAPSRIVFCGQGPKFQNRWQGQLKGLGSPVACADGGPIAREIEAQAPLLVLSPDGFPEACALKDFVRQAGMSGQPVRWLWGQETVAAYYPKAGELVSGQDTAAQLAQKALSSAETVQRPQAGWLSAKDPGSIQKAEEALCAQLPRKTDGYLARFDRRLSITLSRVLLKTPITPNQITTASFILGLLGAWGLAWGSYPWQLLGALILWFCCILDGCDGEVARLKLLCTKGGAAYDLAADHLSHLATFAAVPVGVYRADPQVHFLLPGILLVTGFLGCMASVWWLVLRVPEEKRGAFSLLIERVASRDYVYLILILAALGRLEWFLWTAAFGSHLFYLGLWGLRLRRPSP